MLIKPCQVGCLTLPLLVQELSLDEKSVRKSELLEAFTAGEDSHGTCLKDRPKRESTRKKAAPVPRKSIQRGDEWGHLRAGCKAVAAMKGDSAPKKEEGAGGFIAPAHDTRRMSVRARKSVAAAENAARRERGEAPLAAMDAYHFTNTMLQAHGKQLSAKELREQVHAPLSRASARRSSGHGLPQPPFALCVAATAPLCAADFKARRLRG